MKSLAKVVLAMALILSAFTTPGKLAVTSTAFSNNGMIPAKYSCEGAEVSPPLKVTGVPVGARSLALIVHDPDAPKAGGVTHWIAWNLPVDGIIPENFKGAEQGLNSANTKGYKGMCPPSGIHHYHFRVYALDVRVQAGGTTVKAGLEKAMKGHILAQGELVGLYSKSK